MPSKIKNTVYTDRCKKYGEVKTMEKGLVHVYCGEGKGKTTSAIGLGIRAIGNNLKVIMIQFLKNNNTGECKALAALEPQFKVFHFEKERGFTWTLTEEEKEELKNEIQIAIKFAKKVMDTEECDVLILDEILGAIKAGFLETQDVCTLIEEKSEYVELILTGRYVPDEIQEKADYISRIEPVKHPINKGIMARKGIEY
ncbi:MAG: cob(I)yrinic acid a,c-diamide adenosyltransferase [Cellulosilyticaceae bacterium]